MAKLQLPLATVAFSRASLSLGLSTLSARETSGLSTLARLSVDPLLGDRGEHVHPPNRGCFTRSYLVLYLVYLVLYLVYLVLLFTW